MAPSERKEGIGIPFGMAPISAQALEITSHLRKVSLPKQWTAIKRWKDLKSEEVKAILESEGPRAFEDLRKTTGQRDNRPPLLRWATKSTGEKVAELTPEGALRLRVRAGTGRGFVDKNSIGEEVFCKLYEVGRGGYIEIGLSRDGLAAPLFVDWQESERKAFEAEQERFRKRPPLFPELYREHMELVDWWLARIRIWDESRRIMEAILGQVGKQGRNPVEIPAEAFRVLLWPDRARDRAWPTNWRQRIENALTSLNKFTFTLRTYGLDHLRGYGSMVAQWMYKGLGDGDHGDGVYLVAVSPGFLGCLQVFESGKVHLRSGIEAISYHFAKELTAEEKESVGWRTRRGKRERGKASDTFITMDAGGAFYNAAAGLTSTQENLAAFLERNITRRGSMACAKNKAAKVAKNARDAKAPRLYTNAFCPLLPEGKHYHGALGNFAHNPEAGFTIGGAENRKGRRTGGLLHHMGYFLADRSKRAKTVTKALEDIQAVVVEYLGGVVAGYHDGRWVSFETFQNLDERTLTKGLRLLVFLPENWRDIRKERWETSTDRRVTEDLAEAEREVWEGESSEEALTGDAVVSEEDGFRGWPLSRRLLATIKKRDLRQKDVATLFGVSAVSVTYWVRGQNSHGERKRIPDRLAPLLIRWIETGETPTPEELAVSKGEAK